MTTYRRLHTLDVLKMLLVVTAISSSSLADKIEEKASREVGAAVEPEGSGEESVELIEEESSEGERTHRANTFPDEDEVNLREY